MCWRESSPPGGRTRAPSSERVELTEERELVGLTDAHGQVVRASSPTLKKAMGKLMTSAQYHAGILLKVNLKLGGANPNRASSSQLIALSAASQDRPIVLLGASGCGRSKCIPVCRMMKLIRTILLRAGIFDV